MIKTMSEGSSAWLHSARGTVRLLKVDDGVWGWTLLCEFQQYFYRRITRSAHQAGFPIIQLAGHPILIEEALHLSVATTRDQIRQRKTKSTQWLQYPFSFISRAGVARGYADSRDSFWGTKEQADCANLVRAVRRELVEETERLLTLSKRV
jgi:hypothetical protein